MIVLPREEELFYLSLVSAIIVAVVVVMSGQRVQDQKLETVKASQQTIQ